MLIEATTPLTVKFSTGDIRMTPGVPIEMETAQAQRLLAKAPGKVRDAWLAAWRELAALTYGITGDDPRYPGVMTALNACDDDYLNGNWGAFQQNVLMVRQAVDKGRPRAAS